MKDGLRERAIVVGAGQWGRNLVRNFHDLGALAGVVELDARLREAVCATYPDVPVYEDFQNALDAEAEGIVLATPAPTHYALAMAALKAGKDTFVEKPMTLRSQEARALAEYAERSGRVLMVGHLLLYQPAIDWMRGYLATGKAGRVLHVATQRVKLGRVRREENVWWSFAPHDVSVVLALLGQPELRRVVASGQAMLQAGIEDDVRVHLEFDQGKTAFVHCSWYWPVLARSTTVIGDRQMLVYDEAAQTVTVYDKRVDESLKNVDGGSETIAFEETQPLQRECQHFLDCIKSRQRPVSDGWNGVAVVEILEKATELLHG